MRRELQPMLTMDQVAELAQVTTRTVLRWRRRGLLKAYSPNGYNLRFRQGDVERLMKKAADKLVRAS